MEILIALALIAAVGYFVYRRLKRTNMKKEDRANAEKISADSVDSKNP